MTAPLPLIVGGGPVGVAAALFLARGGTPVRLIDKADGPRRHSRALAVNPRTLELLEPTGVTDRLLAIGRKIPGAQLHLSGGRIVQVKSDRLPTKYPFMLAVSQSVTEGFLRDALTAAGGSVEWSTELVDCRPTSDGADVVVRKAGADEPERYTAPWLLAADGARSVAHAALDLATPGSTFPRLWQLADIPLRTDMDEDRAHIFFLPGGRFVFALRVVNHDHPATTPAGAPALWRVLGNLRNPAQHVPDTTVAGPAEWVSAFRIDHRIVQSMQVGPIALAGDAAHVHSPVGARGMNLGIEDAWVYARLTLAGRRAEYGPLRRKADRGVVRRVAAVSRLARGESRRSRLLRRFAMPAALTVPAVRGLMLKTLSGLDHKLPAV